MTISGFDTSSGKSKLNKKAWALKDFKEADYNPRYITERRLEKLGASIKTFGDLSGVVFNRRTNRLISGHQRLKSIGKNKTKIITKHYTDRYGTVEIGYIEVYDEGIIQIPLRIVDWSSDKTEKAANIAANAHGGDFDKEKLAQVLAELDAKVFDVELTGLDPLTLKSLKPLPDLPNAGVGKNSGATRNQFQEYGEDMELTCECPKCGYKW